MGSLIYILLISGYFSLNLTRHGFTAGSYLLLVYLLSAISGALLVFNYEVYSIDKITVWSSIYHCLLLYLFLSPIVNFANIPSNRIRFIALGKMKLLSAFVISISILGIVTDLPNVFYAFSFQDLREVRLLHNSRELYAEGNADGVLEFIGNFGPIASFFAIFLFFYFISYHPREKYFILFLLVSSTSIVISNLAIMGRDGMIRWVLLFLFWFFFFRTHIPAQIKRRILLFSLSIFIPLLGLFILISTSRFGDSSEGLWFSFLSYAGQPFVVFSYVFDYFYESNFGGRLNFPIFFSEGISANNLNQTIYAPFPLNTFSTFVGSFYLDLGLLRTFLLGLLFKIFSSVVLSIRFHQISFSRFVLFSILSNILLLGVFYYMFYSPSEIKFFVLLYFLSLVLRFSKNINIFK